MNALDAVANSIAYLDRRAAARDLWPAGTLAMWRGDELALPDRVLWPEDDAQVHEALRAASAAGTPVVPYGAGSGVCGGAAARQGAWTLDTKRMQGIGQVEPNTWVVEVEAGVNGQHLEDELARQGYTLGHSPSSIGCSTVGGWAAARSAGQFSSRYGVFEDMVMGLDAVAPGIGPFAVGWRGARSPAQQLPDRWLDLLIGSEGTLAVITRVRVRVRPVPQHRWLRGYRFPTIEAALGAMRRLMQGELWPAVVRLYDPIDTFVGGRTRAKAPPSGAGHTERAPSDTTSSWWRRWLGAVDALPLVRRRTLALPLALPGMIQALAERLASGVLLIVGWEGDREVVEASVASGREILDEVGEDLGAEPGERWFHARHHVSYKLMPVFERGGFADTMEIAARWSVLPAAYEAVKRAVGRHVVIMAHMSHVYPEGGCIYFSFAGKGDPQVYRETWARALEAVLASGATVTHHHGVGQLKAEAVSREVGAAVSAWEAAKRELDPAMILNPGRLFVRGVTSAPSPESPLLPMDGLVRQPASAPCVGTRWPWESAAGPPRTAREPWQSAWHEVRGEIDGAPVHLGRGPRSASGPDLRAFVVERDDNATVTLSAEASGPRWAGEVACEHPWAVARTLLRMDVRPSRLGVVEGRLRVELVGPGAERVGSVLCLRVPGMRRVSTQVDLPRIPSALEPCAEDDVDAIWATCQTAWRRATSAADRRSHEELSRDADRAVNAPDDPPRELDAGVPPTDRDEPAAGPPDARRRGADKSKVSSRGASTGARSSRAEGGASAKTRRPARAGSAVAADPAEPTTPVAKADRPARTGGRRRTKRGDDEGGT